LRPRDRELAQQIERGLLAYDRSRRSLPGIHNAANRNIFLEQILESIHRVKFVTALQGRTISELRSDPSSDLFDPLKAAILHQRRAQMDEAFWMVFFFVHFGKHARGGWRYAREVYGRLGEGERSLGLGKHKLKRWGLPRVVRCPSERFKPRGSPRWFWQSPKV
jgi:alpha-glutamyl/putrescinyl thymine pyrophosphorylase-like protein